MTILVKLTFKICFCWLIFTNFLFGEENNASKLPKINKLADGVYEMGSITIHRKDNFISIPAVTNQISGLVEYGLVHENGKIHESLFRTTIRPQVFHTSLLLLKANRLNLFLKICGLKTQNQLITPINVSIYWCCGRAMAQITKKSLKSFLLIKTEKYQWKLNLLFLQDLE